MKRNWELALIEGKAGALAGIAWKSRGNIIAIIERYKGKY